MTKELTGMLIDHYHIGRLVRLTDALVRHQHRSLHSVQSLALDQVLFLLFPQFLTEIHALLKKLLLRLGRLKEI